MTLKSNISHYFIKYFYIVVIAGLTLLGGCTSTSQQPYIVSSDSAPKNPPKNLANIPNAVPKAEPLSKYGNKPVYSVDGETYHVLKSSAGYDAKGIASWYGVKFNGRRTSSGEPYDMYGMTAASKVLPLPTYVRVTNLDNGRQVVVKVNDRGPFHQNRIIDLSYTAAYKLGVLPTGTALVRVQAISSHTPYQEAVTHVQPSHPKIYLQVAALSNHKNAELLVQRLQRQVKEPVILRTAGTNSHPIYRVQIGPLSDVSLSDALYKKIKHEHLGKPFTIVE